MFGATGPARARCSACWRRSIARAAARCGSSVARTSDVHTAPHRTTRASEFPLPGSQRPRELDLLFPHVPSSASEGAADRWLARVALDDVEAAGAFLLARMEQRLRWRARCSTSRSSVARRAVERSRRRSGGSAQTLLTSLRRDGRSWSHPRTISSVASRSRIER